MVKMKKRIKRIVTTLLAAFLVITQVPASINRVEAANEEYPEYLTVGFSQSNPGIKMDCHHDYQIGKNGEPCANVEMYNDPTKHYIIFKYTTDTSAIAYVRCDVFQKQTTPPNPELTTFVVTYKNENGDVLGKEFVNKGNKPKAENMPNVGENGYWTLEGQENSIKPTERVISDNTTFVWHKLDKILIEYKTDNVEMGSVTNGSEEVLIGNENISGSTATAKEGYKFVGWYKGDQEVSKDLKLTSEVVKNNLNKESDKYTNTTFTAKFEKDITKWHKVTYECDSRYAEFVGENEIKNKKEYKDILEGTSWTVVQSPELKITNNDYYFNGWKEDGKLVLDFPETVTESHAYKANIVKKTELTKTEFTVSKPIDETYDGKDHKKSVTVTDIKTGKVLTKNVDYTLEYQDGTGATKTSFKDVGIVKVFVKGIGSYKGEIETSYWINRKEVMITSSNEEKVWDGTPLQGKEVTAEGFVEGEGVETYEFISSITDVSKPLNESKNEFKIKEFKSNTNEENYKINFKYGTLTIYGQVKYDLNGGEGVAEDSNQYLNGNQVTLVSGEDIKKKNCVFLGWSNKKHDDLEKAEEIKEISFYNTAKMMEKNRTFYAVWAKDVKSTNPQDPDKPDGIPDIYQAKITFNSENGTFKDGSREKYVYVTLLKDGNPSEKGSYSMVNAITDGIIPEIGEPDSGYASVITKVDDFGSYKEKAKWHTSSGKEIEEWNQTVKNAGSTFTYKYLKLEEVEEVKKLYSIETQNYIEKDKQLIEVGDGGIVVQSMMTPTEASSYKLKKEDIMNADGSQSLIPDPNKPVNPLLKGYVFDRLELVEGKESYEDTTGKKVTVINYNDIKEGYTVELNAEFRYIYAIDANNDGIADKYQAKVQFEAINGKVNINEMYVTLYAEDGKTYAENGIGHLTEEQIEKLNVEADNGYDKETLKWTPALTSDVKKNGKLFIASFEKASYNLTVNYVDEDGNKLADAHTAQVLFEDQYSVESPVVEGYTLLDPKEATIEGTMGTSDISINVVYATDEKGTDPENPDKGDGVPDKYQVEVKFEAVNGTVSMDKTYVTLTDEDGNYSENGKGFLTEEQIAVAKASDGYDQDSLVWTPVVPTKDVEITKAMTFTATFEEIEQPVVPVDPVDPPVGPTDPETPVTPEDPDITVTPDPETPATTPVTTTPATPEVTTPVDNTPAQVDGEPVVDVVEDENTPLANLPEEDVDDNQTPLAGLNGGWALVNLISTVITVLFGLFLLISKKKKEEDKEDDEKQMNVNMDEDAEEIRKRGMFTRILSVIVAIVSVIVFFLTEDLTLKMVMTDKWTLLMVVFALVQVVIFFVGRKWKSPKGNKPEQQAAMQ